MPTQILTTLSVSEPTEGRNGSVADQIPEYPSVVRTPSERTGMIRITLARRA